MDDSELPKDWISKMSQKHNKIYYFNTITGETSWKFPTIEEEKVCSPNTGNKRSIDEVLLLKDSKPALKKKLSEEIPLKVEIAVIVPYRDLHVEQKRKLHLDHFIPEMTNFLLQSNKSFKIYIVEQSNDNRKFNRGKLLNIGYELAKRDGCEIFTFHDVDLIPSKELLKYYTTKPMKENPVHIARVWDRYSGNKSYFGGIVTFSTEQYENINGYPNNFWGWGGEDDELYKRTKKLNYQIISPTEGSIIDLEEMTLNDKLNFLREHKVWKCMNKVEVLAEHESTWSQNGLCNLSYKELSSTILNDHSVMIKVDVLLNDHWSDYVCDLSNKQLELSVNELKQKMIEKKK